MSTRARRLAMLAATGLAGAGLIGTALALTPPRAAAIAAGGRIYAAACAGCHGVAGGAAPPLDAAGHAWEHADAVLLGVIAEGTPAGMPGFAGRLDPAERRAVLGFLKAQWPEAERRWQATLNPGGGAALAALLRDPDWRAPGDCPPAAR